MAGYGRSENLLGKLQPENDESVSSDGANTGSLVICTKENTAMKTSFLLASIGCFGFASSAYAHADQTQPAETETPVVEESNADRVHLSLDLSFTNQYFFRGIIQEDTGFIFQPSVEIGFDIHESDDWSLGAYVGIWSSFHDEHTGASSPDEFISSWYEFDFYTGLTLSTGRLSADLAYANYASPNDAFGHVEEVILTVGWDDSGWLESVTLSPYALLAVEMGSNQADGGSELGTFLAVGLEPSHTYESTPVGGVTISVPIEAGFSLSDYYEGAAGDESFGYFTAGLAASIPLPAPDGFGDWTWSVGFDYLLLGDSNEAINGSDSDEWILHTGISFEF